MSVGGEVVTDVGYYAGGGGVAAGMENYYTHSSGSADREGVWGGKLAQDLGLTGQVDGDVMQQVYGEWVAPDGTKLGRQAPAAKGVFRPIAAQVEEWKAEHPDALPEAIESAKRSIEAKARNANLGVDLTFSVPKSISLLHSAVWRQEFEAIEAGDSIRSAEWRSIRQGIESAIEAGNQAFLDYASSVAMNQTGRHGGTGVAGTWTAAPDLAYSSFFQFTSRAIQPQLHIHNVILNRARGVDGVVRGLDTKDLLAHRHAYGAIADRTMVEKLTAMGIEMEMRLDGRERPSWEVKGIGREMVETVSDRRMTIRGKFAEQLAEAEASANRELTDPERWRLKKEITLQTRQRKTGNAESVPVLLERIQKEISDKLATGMGPIAERARVAVNARTRANERGESIQGESWSPQAVCSEAVAAVSDKMATWRRPDLMLEIEQRLPLLGSDMSGKDVTELLERLTDVALQDDRLVTQTAGREGIAVPYELGGPGKFTRPTERRYAATGSIEAERALREAAAGVGRHHVSPTAMASWLADHDRYSGAGDDQRAAAIGLVSSDHGIVTFEAPAGTGKSFTLGAVAEAWEALSGGGRVHGLAPSERAAQVLEDDGVKLTANTAKWLAAQERISQGRALPDDLRFRVHSKDIVVVDEASMVSQEHARQVRELVESKGARIIFAGDPGQLSSPAPGDVLGILAGHAERYQLSDVRRFAAEWEAAASLRLREGDETVLEEYDRRGRIEDCASLDEAITKAAWAVVAGRLDTSPITLRGGRVEERPNGRDVIITTSTNEVAAAVSSAVRDILVERGLVQEAGIDLETHGGTAGVGDHVACRENSRRLGVTNRRLYTVAEVHEDGGISVASHATGEIHRLPSWYVSKHVSSGYAGTSHATQGMTVDGGARVEDGTGDRAGFYVGTTRGREMNRVYVVTAVKDEDPSKAKAVEEYQARGTGEVMQRSHEFDGSKERATGVEVLKGVLARDGSDQAAAIVMLDQDDERMRNMATLHGLREYAVEKGGVTRTLGWLDELAAVGILDSGDRARLVSDQGVTQMSNLLRTLEQAGHDPKASLTHAVMDERGFGDAKSIAQVLQARISQTFEAATGERPEATSPTEAPVPAGLSERVSRFVEQIREAQDDRRRELGSQLAAESPAWALRAFGRVPDEPTARLGWEHRAGIVAGYREGRGWTDDRRPIDAAPGISTTERRAAWHEAWEALGRPEVGREEASMSEGQLRLRINAWKNEQKWAPAHANEALRANSLEADEAHVEAIHAATDADAEFWEKEEAVRRDNVDVLSRTAEARDGWSAETAETQAAAQRAEKELETRGLAPVGQEPDRTTAAEWLAAQRAADELEDPAREIGELDIRDEVRDRELAAGFVDRSGDLAMVEVTGPVRDEGAARRTAPIEPTEEERIAMEDRASSVEDLIADRRSQEESASLDLVDDPYEAPTVPAQQQAERGDEMVAEIA